MSVPVELPPDDLIASRAEFEEEVRLPFDLLLEVASGKESQETHSALSEVQLDTRRYLFGAFCDFAANNPESMGDLGSFAETWAVLGEIEDARAELFESAGLPERDGFALDGMFMRPGFGNWVVHAINRLEEPGQASDVPLWVDVGYINSMAASAACHAGRDFALQIPVVRGRAHIPMFGTVLLPEAQEWDKATIAVQDGQVTVRHDEVTIDLGRVGRLGELPDSEHWQHLYTYVSAYASGMIVQIDDLDPYSGQVSPLAPQRLTPEELAEWERVIDASEDILIEHPEQLEQLAHGVSTINPLPGRPQFKAVSSSTNTGVGAVIASLPFDAREGAATWIHEYGHSKLNMILACMELLPTDQGESYFTGWRDDPRPLGGLIHGVFSFTEVADFWRRQRFLDTDSNNGVLPVFADFEFGIWCEQAQSAMFDIYETLGAQDLHPSPLAWVFIEGLERRLYDMMQDVPPMPENVERLKIAKADHLGLSAVYHAVPDAESIGLLAKAWINGASEPPLKMKEIPTKVVANPDACNLDIRPNYIREYIMNPLGFEEDFKKCVPSMERGDRALAMGRPDIAHIFYDTILAQNPLDARAFVGAVLTTPGRAKRGIAWSHIALATQARLIEETGFTAPIPDLMKWLDLTGEPQYVHASAQKHTNHERSEVARFAQTTIVRSQVAHP